MKIRNFLILIIMAIILLPNISHAGLQANPNTQYTLEARPAYWMTAIRQMEVSNEAMGLSETFNSDYTSKISNNIDVHMIRSTEYGAILILSASGYGNPSNAKEVTSTTGNNTGVMIDYGEYTEELVAGTSSSFSTNTRYWDKYNNDSGATYKVGDSLVECREWHWSYYTKWVTSNDPFFSRSSDGIFSIFGINADAAKSCRGVAVCGEGL